MDAVGSIVENSFSYEWKIPKYTSLTKEIVSDEFNFSGCTWMLEIARYSTTIGIYLYPMTRCEVPDSDRRNSITCFSGYKKANGKAVEVSTARIDFGATVFNYELLALTDYPELKSLDPLIFICRMEESSIYPAINVLSFPLKHMDITTLSSNFEDLFTSKRKCDVIVKGGNKEFKAHKAVLMARTTVFDMTLTNLSEEEERTGVVDLSMKINDTDPFEEFLHYLYTGRFDRVSSKNAHQLYNISDKFDIGELKPFCITHMMRNLTLENMFDLAKLADQCRIGELMSSVQLFFNKNVNKIISTVQWEMLTKHRYPLAKKLLQGMLAHYKIRDKS